jgi:hypothetical protein
VARWCGVVVEDVEVTVSKYEPDGYLAAKRARALDWMRDLRDGMWMVRMGRWDGAGTGSAGRWGLEGRGWIGR